MAKKTIDKDTKVTTTKTVEDASVVSEQKEDNVVNLENVDDAEDKKDVSEVIAPENISENVEKVDEPENSEPLDKPEAPAEMLNESASDDKKDEEDKDEDSKDDEEKAGYTVDTPAISELIDPESAGMSSITPTYVACPPIKDTYVAQEVTPTYTAQCPPKPATEKQDAYVAQRPY